MTGIRIDLVGPAARLLPRWIDCKLLLGVAAICPGALSRRTSAEGRVRTASDPRNDDMLQFNRGDSRHSRQAAGRGWKCRRRRASGVVSDGLDSHQEISKQPIVLESCD